MEQRRIVVAGRAQFVVVGSFPGRPVTEGAPPDTVAAVVEFTVASNPD